MSYLIQLKTADVAQFLLAALAVMLVGM